MIATSIAPANPTESRVSPDQYRALESQREQRHEYDNGLEIPMTGGSYRHSQLITNLLVLLATALEDSDYAVHASDLRVWIPQWSAGTYPDLLVIQGEPRFTADRTDEVLNPTLIVEVLSPSTAEYDRTKKFEKYCLIPEFREYLLVSQTEAAIDRFWLGEDGDWRWRRVVGLEQDLVIATGCLSLPLAKIYRSVKWD
jgi:Uma2 family endonuclease